MKAMEGGIRKAKGKAQKAKGKRQKAKVETVLFFSCFPIYPLSLILYPFIPIPFFSLQPKAYSLAYFLQLCTDKS
jgi:hypothetical protein